MENITACENITAKHWGITRNIYWKNTIENTGIYNIYFINTIRNETALQIA